MTTTGRRLILAAFGVLTLGACGLRAPHSEVVAQYAPQGASQQQSALGAGGGAVPSGAAQQPSDVTATGGAAQVPDAAATAGPAPTAGGGDGGVPVATGGPTAATVTRNAQKGTARAAATQAAGGGGSTTQAKATNAPGAGSTIVLGSDEIISGVSSNGLEAKQTLIAWQNWVNKSGGIVGHPVQVVAEDDGGDASRATTNVEDLVENHHAIAILPGLGTGIESYLNYLQQKNVPLLGGFEIDPDWWTSPIGFPQGSEEAAGIEAYDIGLAQLAHKKTLGILYCAESPSCGADATFAANYAAKAGLTLALKQEVSVAQPDFTTNCLQMQGKGVDALVLLADTASVSRIVQNCSAQGYAPTYAAEGDNSLAQLPAMNGAIAESSSFSWTDTTTPAAATFRQVLLDAGITPSQQDAMMWSGAEEVRKALTQADAVGTVTPTVLENALHQFKNETLGGLVPAPGMTFPAGGTAVKNLCFVPMIVQNKAWTAAAKELCAQP